MLASVLLFSILIKLVITQDCPLGYEKDSSSITKNQRINWTPCIDKDNPRRECGSFKVPLDYTGVTSGVLTIPVARIKPEKNGIGKSVFYNPGGPGVPAIPVLNGDSGQNLLDTVGHGYNVVTFDPRGCGITIPFPCAKATPAYNYSQINEDALWYIQVSDQAAKCAKPETRIHGQLMGTSFVARDIMALFDAINEDGMIRYYGASYGTILGATLAAMFPDKIDRMVLDGNINPTEFYHGMYAESAAGIDPAVAYFFDQCATERATYCPFSVAGNTPKELQDAYNEMQSCLSEEKCPIYDAADETFNPREVFDGHRVRNQFIESLKSPHLYYYTSAMLAYMWQKYKGNSITVDWSPLNSSNEDDPTPNAIHAVNCGDWDDIPGTTTDFRDWLGLYEKVSLFAPDSAIGILYQCSAWQLNARGKYNGSWSNINTASPILFVNSPYDPLTPLESAHNSSKSFVGSGVLVHVGPGHCSSSSPSQCTTDRVLQYFATGELPDLTTSCRPSKPPFEAARAVYEILRASTPDNDSASPYADALESVRRQNDHLLISEHGCIPITAEVNNNDGDDNGALVGQSEGEDAVQKGFSDFRVACKDATEQKWLFSLICKSLS